MKKLLLLICIGFFTIGFTNDAKATHIAGGEITYEYVGDSTGIPFNYCITLTLYRDRGGVNLGGTQNLFIRSGCFTAPNVTLNGVASNGANGSNVPNFLPCVNSNDPGLFDFGQYTYKACVVLPGKCSDWSFAWSSCCRNGAITNGPRNQGFYIESTLNNTRQPNTSPVFVNPAAKAFCVSQSPFVWSQNAVEPDSDSLDFKLGQPLAGAGFPPTGVAIPWAPGFSTPFPMTTANGISVNSKNGTFVFQPTQPEVDVIKVVVEEFRYDTILQVYYRVGSIFRELQVPIVATCNPVAQAGLTIDSTVLGSTGQPAGTALYRVDSLFQAFGISQIGSSQVIGSGAAASARLPVVPYDCFDDVVTVDFTKGLVCDSFSVDGSEFRIIGPDGVLRPVIGVNTKCQPDLLTRQVDLLLHKSLDTVGDFLLYIKTGNDGNSLMNECGYPVDSFFAIIIRIETCPYPDYKLNNVTVDKDEDIIIDWEIDINSYVPSAFTAWNILRANSNDQYYLLASEDGPGAVNLRTFTDTTLSPADVDLSQFQYMVQLVQNGKSYPPTNQIFSILLHDTVNAENDGTLYDWSTYIGWDSVAYEFQHGRYDSTLMAIAWNTLQGDGPKPDYFNDAYTWPLCENNRDTSGLYAFRVLASDIGNTSNTFISESNWLYFAIDCQAPIPDPKPVDPIIPTVFTPNGDSQNDLFEITADYQYAEIGIYNRWGKPVATLSGDPDVIAWDGRDQNSGVQVADGVYYFIVKLKSDLDDGAGNFNTVTFEKSGSVTIFSNGNTN